MDNTLQHFTLNSTLNASKNLGKLGDAGVAYYGDTILRLDHSSPTPYFSNLKGTGRKWSVIDGSKGLQDGSSLVLGLGCSASSKDSRGSSVIACTAISSAKEIEDDPKMDLDLDFHLHVGNKTPNAKKISNATPEALEVERPKVDLQLSLSTRPAESGITSTMPGSTPFENIEMPIIARGAQLVDEGSKSSGWTSRHLVPTLVAATFDHVPSHINPSLIIPDPSSIVLAAAEGSVSAPGTTYQQMQQSSGMKICQVLGCGRGARGASGLCVAHGSGSRCQKEGCQKGAEGKTVFCKAHGGGRRCQHLGCTKSAEGRTDYCIAHGGGRRCNHENCTRAARGKSGLCIRHGGGKRCQMENCTKSAEGLSGLCIAHGGGRRCQLPGCTKGAQGRTMFCKAHGGGRRCTAPGCTKGAEGSTSFCKNHGGGKRCSHQGGGVCPKSVHGGTLYCVRHGGGKRCAMTGCTKSARGRTNYCVRHGGGRRCQYEGCDKSAQGSTDYCKAHGGGRKCIWDQLRSKFGGQAAGSCDKFVRGKSGLCAAHSALVQDKRVHGVDTLGITLQDLQYGTSMRTKEVVAFEDSQADGMSTVCTEWNSASWEATGLTVFGCPTVPMYIPSPHNYSVGKNGTVCFSLPEGRVHGGHLMTMLSVCTSVGPISNDGEHSVCTSVGTISNVSDPSNPRETHPVLHSWV